MSRRDLAILAIHARIDAERDELLKRVVSPAAILRLHVVTECLRRARLRALEKGVMS